MARKPPTCKLPEKLERKPGTQIVQERIYHLLTPLFGGGIDPQKPDPITTVRATSIRGQLRFWWRATRGGNYSTLDELRQHEQAIWGGPARFENDKPIVGRSRVTVELLKWPEKTEKTPPTFQADTRNPGLTLGEPKSNYSYVAFPLNQEHGSATAPFDFTVQLRFPASIELNKQQIDMEQEVAAALWAWETFGGIGGRTRRGFGALECTKLKQNGVELTPDRPTSPDTLTAWLSERFQRYAAGIWAQALGDVPHLQSGQRVVITPPEHDNLAAWRQLFLALKRFRQDRNPGTTVKRPGRSRWPEPEAIRVLTKQRSAQHQKMHTSGKFPRAVFGLPIIFQFKKDERDNDPGQSSLQTNKVNRYASRLILRPVRCTNGAAVGLALVLYGPLLPPGELILTGKRYTSPPLDTTLTGQEAAEIPMLNGEKDPLAAFLNYLEKLPR